MGDHRVTANADKQLRIDFIRHLLNDILALEQMLERNLIENDITRIGAEQEFCLVTDNWRPAKNAQSILEAVNNPHFTTELARYNLEINLDPVVLAGRCFSQMESQLRELLSLARSVAEKSNTRVLLTGILPTISKVELAIDYLTPSPRYWALNDMLKEQKRRDFELRLRGVDELAILHDSVLFEACNTSFQMHLQIAPEDFIASYNWAQAIAGPVLGVSTNSPLLLGRELWSETRIALFQQSIDTRNTSYALKDQQARVTFGDTWASGSIVELFKNELARYKVILSREIHADSLQQLLQGDIPGLEALNLHNSTIYRWNRPCYGVGGGRAHVRIENRYIPSGPTILDEMANFAFWVGLMVGRPREFDDLPACMDFRDAKANFIKAARTGKESVMSWRGELVSVRDLVLKTLLPIARSGLDKSGVDSADAERLLTVIEHRAAGITGSQWSVGSYRALRKNARQDDALLALTKCMYRNQQSNRPVHQWPLVAGAPDIHEAAHQVQHVMSTQLFTVNENDLAELAISIMLWKNIHHVPVEDDAGDLCGLLTWTHIKRFRERAGNQDDRTVADIMTRDVLTVAPDTEITEAIQQMKQREFGCLPVVQDRHLVGIITIADVIHCDR